MSFVCEGKHLTVTTAVAIGSEVIPGTVRMKCKDTAHFFLAVTVGGEETAGKPSVNNFYLSAHYGDRRKERLHPVVDAGTDDEYH